MVFLQSLIRNSHSVKLASQLLQSQFRFLSSIVTIQGNNDFTDKVLKSKVPVLIDFHATWCGPCKLLGPRLEHLMEEYNDKVILAKVDIDELDEIAMQFNVTSVPTVVGLKDGKEINRFIGLQEEEKIKTFVDQLL